MTTMIALVGEQPLPNFLPVRHYQYKDVLLVYTAKTQKKYEYLKATLQKETLQQKINVYGIETDPYDISVIARALGEELGKLATVVSLPLVFNLTGATKVMSLAAYQVAQQYNAAMIYLQSEGSQTCVYHYIWQNQQLQAVGSDLLSEHITLRDVFDLYFGPGKGNWQELGSNREGGGSPFEIVLANALRSDGYEVMIGVRGLSGQIDVDIAVRLGNQYGIIEAKSGKNGKELKGIQQLSTAARHLGTFMQSFYVITVPPETNHTAITAASSIQVISLPSYDSTTNTLSPAEVTELLSRVGKSFKR